MRIMEFLRADSTSEQLAKSERDIRDERERREQAQRDDDRAFRTKLERASPSANRLGIVDYLNGTARDQERRELPGIGAIQVIREIQKIGYRTASQHNETYARESLEKIAGEAFDRLHPQSALRGRHPLARSTPMPVRGGGASFPSPRLDPTRDTRARSEIRQGRGIHEAPSGFNFASGEPGNVPGNYYEPAEGSAEGSARRVRDAGGSVRGDNEGGRHWPRGEPEPVDPEFVLAVARAIIAMVNSRKYPQNKV